MNIIKKAIGKLTKPENAIFIHDDWYVEPIYVVSMFDYIRAFDGHREKKYKYCYQKIEQDFLGVWRLRSSWLETDTNYRLLTGVKL